MINRLAIASLIAAAAGCSDNAFENESSRFEGIYRVDSRTENLDACAPGGSAVPINDQFAVAVYSNESFPVGLKLVSCASPDACRTLLGVIESNGSYASDFSFVAVESSAGALTGGSISTGFSDGQLCRMAEVTAFTMTLDGDALTIEEQHTIAPDFESNNGLCDTRVTQQKVEGLSCSQLDVLTFTRIDAL